MGANIIIILMQLEDEPKEKCLKEKCVPGVWEGSRPLVFENSYRSLQERRRKWKGVKYDVLIFALFLKIVPMQGKFGS